MAHDVMDCHQNLPYKLVYCSRDPTLVEEVREEIGADWLVYQDLEDLIECSREGNPEVDGFESSVFDGQYLAGNIDDQYLQSIEAARSDGAKGRGPFLGASEGAVVGLHNDN